VWNSLTHCFFVFLCYSEWRETVVQLIATDCFVLFFVVLERGDEFVFVDESESGEGQLRSRCSLI
jgi:hypothetical protein